ncbi:MAG: threonine--tRNA ligase, partial [Bacteroidia bacterium]|nr:threonine--tRNA ligase [Bacteroidia bacterium]MDW8333475.1 threonine--tRNA ligase [Bacteroidia bacterium]
ISRSLAQKALAAKVNGTVQDLSMPIESDATVQILTWDDPEGKAVFWHSSAHILAEAVETLFPGVKFGVGPPIESGFYYDIDFGDHRPKPEDLEAIEKKFLELAASGETFVRENVSKADALKYFQEKGDPYKVELIEGLEDGKITFYRSGNFVDLCKGPHIPNSKVVKAVKILSTAGAYWRGDSKNKQLTRLYAVSFPSQKELDEHLFRLEEAQRRDHRRLGRELDLFSFHEEGPGFPFWHPNGMTVLNELQNYLRKKLLDLDYREIRTPVILNESLWQRSGHYANYKENMYFTQIDETSYAVKPMNCPGSTLVYRTAPRSYRDLPLRLFEFGLVHRHELSGVLTGLFRVRSFTQDDAHIFCTPEQVESEIAALIRLIFEVYATFGFHSVNVFLSTRPEKYIGTLEMWNAAENALQSALNNARVAFQINAGDGAFYGPKIDFVVKDSLLRSWQLGTIQLDFSMPQRFELEYVAPDGSLQRPVMIHRAVLGSFERFFGILIEHTGGNFPFWLAPVQVVVLPVSDKHLDYARFVKNELGRDGRRIRVDERNEKIGRKIRDAEVAKIPVMLVVGEREIAEHGAALRIHGEGDKGFLKLDDVRQFLADLQAASFSAPQPVD